MQQINIKELNVFNRKPQESIDVSKERLNWILLKKKLSKMNNICLSDLSQKIFNSSLPLYNVITQVHNYKDYLIYEKSNLHGGCNDKFTTKHERIFKEMYPYLECQISFGTGKDGYKKYGVKRYIADFVDRKSRTIIEIDGSNHTNKLQQLKDKMRRIFFLENNYMTIRFSNDEVIKLYKLYCNKIEKEIENEYENNKHTH